MEDVAPSRTAADALAGPTASRSRTEMRRLATVACHYLETAGRRRTRLPAWNDNGDRRIALDAALTQKGNNSELRSSLPINTREFLRAVRVSRHSLYVQAHVWCSSLASKHVRQQTDFHQKRIVRQFSMAHFYDRGRRGACRFPKQLVCKGPIYLF